MSMEVLSLWIMPAIYYASINNTSSQFFHFPTPEQVLEREKTWQKKDADTSTSFTSNSGSKPTITAANAELYRQRQTFCFNEKKMLVSWIFPLFRKHSNIYILKSTKTSTHHPLWNDYVHFFHRKVNFLYSALDQCDGVFEFIWPRKQQKWK